MRKKKKQLKKNKTAGKSGNEKFVLNPSFEFFPELRSLVLKSSPAEMSHMASRIQKLGKVKLAIIAGIFFNDMDSVDSYDTPADLFIVGDDVNKKRLRSFLGALEAEVGMEIKFTLMDKEEFEYRLGMFDRFVRVLLEGPHEKIINKLGL